MTLPMFTPPSAATVFNNTAASAAAQKAVESTSGLIEPLSRGTERKTLRRDIQTSQSTEYRQRERVRSLAEELPRDKALQKSPPESRRQSSWWPSHEDRVQQLTEKQVRAEERVAKVANFGAKVACLQQQYEAEKAACYQRLETVKKAVDHENKSTSGWTGWW